MLSIVIPVYNEAESLETLFAEISAVAATEQYELDVVFVDDGSSDGSWERIVALATQDRRVRGIRFRRNFGKAAALNAGFAIVRGEIVMTLDADLQDDPHEIPRFVALLSQGLDVVSGWKRTRHDPWHKVGPSRVFNALVSWLTGVSLHDHNCGMKGYRRAVLREVWLYGELHRFVPVLAAARGFRVGEHIVQHRARRFGHSKFGVERLIKGFLDLLSVKFLTTYGHRPLHFLGTMAAVFGAFGVLRYLGYKLYAYLVVPAASTAYAADKGEPLARLAVDTAEAMSLYFWLLLASLCFLAGLLAELIVATHGRNRDLFSIAETVGSASETAT